MSEAHAHVPAANALAWALWPIDCPRCVLSSCGLVSAVASYLDWLAQLPVTAHSARPS